jgi:hypothetical protein
MRKFWNYMRKFPQPTPASNTAYVLPQDYGYGFRGPNDQIWALWSSDELSPKVWNEVSDLLISFSVKLDIIYETKELDNVQRYDTLIFWNGSTIQR